MPQCTTHLYRLVCCGWIVLYVVACSPAKPAPNVARPAVNASQSLKPPSLPEGKHAIAIFPWSITGGFEDEILAEPEGLNALSTALRGTNFIPTHSYYQMEAFRPQQLTKNAFPTLRRVWRGKNLNTETILRLGNQLGVQAVFMYDMDINHGTDVLRVYLMDVASQKLYEAKGETQDFAENSYGVLLGLAQEVFTAYTHDRA